MGGHSGYISDMRFSRSYLGDADPVNPLVEGSDVIAAQVLDVLRLLLDLWMLKHTARAREMRGKLPWRRHVPPCPKILVCSPTEPRGASHAG